MVVNVDGPPPSMGSDSGPALTFTTAPDSKDLVLAGDTGAASMSSCIANLANTILGAGMLGLPPSPPVVSIRSPRTVLLPDSLCRLSLAVCCNQACLMLSGSADG